MIIEIWSALALRQSGLSESSQPRRGVYRVGGLDREVFGK